MKTDGYPKGVDMKIAAKVDLIVLPVAGTNCGNCLFFDKKEQFCNNKKVKQPVNSGLCCSLWDNSNVKRPWGKELANNADYPLYGQKECPNCGYEIPRMAKVCPFCGYIIVGPYPGEETAATNMKATTRNLIINKIMPRAKFVKKVKGAVCPVCKTNVVNGKCPGCGMIMNMTTNTWTDAARAAAAVARKHGFQHFHSANGKHVFTHSARRLVITDSGRWTHKGAYQHAQYGMKKNPKHRRDVEKKSEGGRPTLGTGTSAHELNRHLGSFHQSTK